MLRDGVWPSVSLGYAIVARSRNNVFMKLGADFDAFTVHPKTFHDAGKVVVVEGRYTGTNKKTGRNLDAQVCHVWRLRDGKVAKFQQYIDTAHIQEVMGV